MWYYFGKYWNTDVLYFDDSGNIKLLIFLLFFLFEVAKDAIFRKYGLGTNLTQQ